MLELLETIGMIGLAVCDFIQWFGWLWARDE